ncbi:MAG TPA: hypothetical protein ENN33_09015 [Ignavibacteria bacterium]|nr:hypothetical protein [Ignavibacteria bacterium]
MKDKKYSQVTNKKFEAFLNRICDNALEASHRFILKSSVFYPYDSAKLSLFFLSSDQGEKLSGLYTISANGQSQDKKILSTSQSAKKRKRHAESMKDRLLIKKIASA